MIKKCHKSMWIITYFVFLWLQKARLARIQIAKATSGAAFVSKKKAAEAKMAAKAAGLPFDENFKEDVFELQHHHLLRCLEKTTVRQIGWATTTLGSLIFFKFRNYCIRKLEVWTLKLTLRPSHFLYYQKKVVKMRGQKCFVRFFF